ncbi:MAG: hypothetical protein ABMA13_21630 [Chthoniobacteraceae bacterium]
MLQLVLAENRTTFSPGDTIAGTARWQRPEAPGHVEITLVWSTSGKGNVDSEVVATATVANPMPSGEHAFRFTAPAEPHSFSGQLITLTWAVEVHVDPDEEIDHVEIVIAPGGRAIELPRIAPPPPRLPGQEDSFLKKLLSRVPQR